MRESKVEKISGDRTESDSKEKTGNAERKNVALLKHNHDLPHLVAGEAAPIFKMRWLNDFAT